MKIDIGCGTRKQEGFVGVDAIAFPGVDHVCRVGVDPLPFPDESVDEVYSSHFLEHLTQEERIVFFNELYRVMKPGAQARIITPHWASNRAYGDPTHKWPGVSEMSYNYLNREWREREAPHTDAANWPKGFNCNFNSVGVYYFSDKLKFRNDEYRVYAMTNFKEAIDDLHTTLTKV